MPLPDSGEISAQDINVDIGREANATLDLDQVSRTFYKLDAPHSFTEFYGKGGSGQQASSISITSTNPVTIGASGGTITVTYTSNGAFSISAPNSYASTSTSIGSGNSSFTVTITSQLLDAASRQALVYLTSTNGGSATLEVNQSANDASISIVKQTGALIFQNTGGEDEVYKIETAPDGTIEWTAELSDTTFFSHRINNTGNYTTNALTGTGDAFIEIKAEPNDSYTTTRSSTITVTATNLTAGGNNGPVTDTVQLLPIPNISVIPFGFGFGSSEFGESNGVGVTPDGQYTIIQVSAGDSNYSITKVVLKGTNAANFQIVFYRSINSYTNEYFLFPTSANTSLTTNRTAYLEVTINTGATDSDFTVTQSKRVVVAPTVSISPTSFTFDDSILTAQTVTGTITNTGGGTISSVNFFLEDGPGSDFKLVDRLSDDDGIVVDTEGFFGTNSSPGTKTVFTIGLEPRVANTTGVALTDRIRFYASNEGATGYSDWIDITQNPNVFEYSNAAITGFAVNRNTGAVTAPTSLNGTTITNRVYSTGYSSGFYPLVTSSTPRSVTVTVTAPATGYSNSGQSVSGTESTTQLAAQEFISLNNNAASATVDGDGNQIQISVETQDIYNTAWSTSITYVNGDNWINFVNPSNSNGDGTITLSASANWPGLSSYRTPDRRAILRVAKNSSVYDDITIIQSAGTPPVNKPIISTHSPSGDISFGYAFYGSNNSITFYVARQASTATNNITPTSVSFYMPTSDFAFYQTDSNVAVQDMGGIWTTTVTNPAASSFSVGIYPVSINEEPTSKTATVQFSMGNSGGTATLSKDVIQTGNTLWALSTIPQFTNASNDTENLSEEFVTNIPYTFDYMYSSYNRTQFGFYVIPGTNLTSRGTSATSRNLTNGQKTFTINNGALYQSGQKVSIQQSVGNAFTYGVGTVVSQVGSTLTVNITSGSGLTSTNYNSWEINQISADDAYKPVLYTRKANSGDIISSQIRIDDTDNAYGLNPLVQNIFQSAGELTGTIYVNGSSIGAIGQPIYETYTSTYSNGYPSPTYYTVGINTNYAGQFTADISQGGAYAGLDTSFDSSGNGSGLLSFNGRTRAGSSATIFYINLASNTTTQARTVMVEIYFEAALGSAILEITVNGTSNTGGGTGGPGKIEF